MGTFSEAVRGDRFAISGELTVKRDSTADDVRRQADRLLPYVDGIQVTDNPYAWVQMSAVAASGILLQHGADPVPVMTCRDRNRAALHGDLAGLAALGVGSLLLIRGHPVPENHAVPARTVFDLTGKELIALADSVAAIDSGGGFFIGTGAKVFRPGARWQAESLSARAEAGARFIQTQLCFNRDIIRRYMERFLAAGLGERYSVMVSLSPLPSAATARWVKKNLSDSRIPAAVVQRLQESGDEAREGIEICAELMREFSGIEGVSGVNLMTTGDPAAIAETVRLSGLRD